MFFLYESILAVFAELIAGIMEFFVGDFWKDLTIVEIENGQVGGYFDDWLPGVQQLRLIFKTIACTLVFLLFFLELFKAFLPDSPGIKTQHPFMTLFRTALAFLTISFSYSLIAVIQTPMAELCDAVYKLPLTKDKLSGGFGDGFGGNIGNAGRVTFPTPDSLMGTLDAASGASHAVVMTISCVVLAAIAWAFIKLIFEMVERYVVMGFLFYAAPLPMAALVSESTQNIFKSYMRMLLSQYLLIMFNFCFLYVFCYAFTVGANLALDDKATPSTVIIYYILLLAWLRLGRMLDEHMSSLGLSVAQTGAGLGGDLIGGALMLRAAAGAAMTGFRAAKSLGGKLGDRRFGERAGAGKDGSFNHGDMPRNLGNAMDNRMGQSAEGRQIADSAGKAFGVDASTIANARAANGQTDIADANGNTISFTPASASTVPSDAMQVAVKGADGQTYIGSVSGDSVGTSPMVASAINDDNVHQALSQRYSGGFVDKVSNGMFAAGTKDGDDYVLANTSLYGVSKGADLSRISRVSIAGQEYLKVSANNKSFLTAKKQAPNAPVNTLGDQVHAAGGGVNFLKNKFVPPKS